ncbi:MAG: UDP-N-acetylmuramoyl-L-alanine--D-glutamate ligase, partial [Lachnospiraceae bacterium]|nr:UDP-N-acetylmuramoyl-L-alanine--D-glutamate ligase [Lachnospiraceae bacterium]
AAVGITYYMGVPVSTIGKVCTEFKGVPHRIEYVKTVNGVEYYNDSKGTNPDAAIKGIKAMKSKTYLIGGGYDKKSSYDEWIDSFDGKVKKLVLLGQTASDIDKSARSRGFVDTVFVKSLEEAVKYCYDMAEPGECVLLSPACASWGMFDNYEQRGDMFKEYVNKL